MPIEDIKLRKVRQVCNARGVTVVAYAGYRRFALQVDRTRKRVSGQDLELVVGALVERYVKLGMDRTVLVAIAFEVFNVRVPSRE
jgi:hypothetical protein